MSLLSQASLVLTPNAIAEDKLYSIIPSNGNGDMTVTRATTATRVNSEGFIEETPYNLVKYSEQFNNTVWAKINSSDTVVENSLIAPNNTITADNIIAGAINSQHGVSQSNVIVNPGTNYTVLIYFKQKEYTSVAIRLGADSVWSGGVAPTVTFNSSTMLATITTGMPTNIIFTQIENGWYKCSFTALSGTGGVSGISTYVKQYFGFLGDGVSGIYVWGAQLTQGSTIKDYFPTTDRLNVPRLNYDVAGGCPSILLEPQRTNSISNSSIIGASVANNTLPTGWQEFTNGLTRTVVGIGVEKNLPYIDIRFNGTATGINSSIRTSGSTSISASSGQNWASSIYFKVIAQPNPPNNYSIGILERNSAGNYLTNSVSVITPLPELTRYNHVRTLNNAATAFVQPQSLDTGLTIGNTYDFTIRIAAPQLELGAYPTSYIPTVASKVTRNADVISRNNIYTNGLITSAGGTWFVELNNNLSLARDGAGGFSIGDLLGNTFNIKANAPNAKLAITKSILNAQTVLYTTITDTVKVVIKWNGSTADVFVNGIKVVSATLFTTTIMEFLSATVVDVPRYIKSILLFPKPLTDTECIQLTTL